MTLSTLLFAITAIALAFKARAYMAEVISARRVSRNSVETDLQPQDTVSGLHQLRRKILRSLFSMFLTFLAQSLVHAMCVVSRNFARYNSYLFVI
eukprot:5397817-Pleurochrysis_carterae.AAC.1